jgi:hypothetical protein
VYLHKKNINGETRLAITAHADGEVGVCFKNHLDHGTPLLVPTVLWLGRTDNRLCLAWVDAHAHETEKTSRVVDLDVDIGADAVDYKYAFHHHVVICLFVCFSDIFSLPFF